MCVHIRWGKKREQRIDMAILGVGRGQQLKKGGNRQSCGVINISRRSPAAN